VNREASQEPRDVVRQDVLGVEDHGRPEYRVRHSGSLDGVFDLGFAAKVRQRRVGHRVRDADVDDPANAGILGGVNQLPGVFSGTLVRELALGEADPVRVE
tara:strand:+ start:1041 stop:1343 length:303 start_codon:yes stop_codon:yes gene_type:complete